MKKKLKNWQKRLFCLGVFLSGGGVDFWKLGHALHLKRCASCPYRSGARDLVFKKKEKTGGLWPSPAIFFFEKG
jgi:hypothetical protein